MQGLVKTVAIAAPAALLMVYLWSGQSHKFEARQQVESATFDRDWEESQAAFASGKVEKAKHLARAQVAQVQISSAQVKSRAAEAKAEKQSTELDKAAEGIDKALDDKDLKP